MNSRIRSLVRKAKAILCVALILNVQYWTGACGQVSVAFPDGWIRVDLGPDHPLVQSLSGGAMAGPTAMLVHPGDRVFRLVYLDSTREIGGTFEFVNGEAVMREMRMNLDGQSGAIDFDPATKQVVRIKSSDGGNWEPRELHSAKGVTGAAPGIDGYTAANGELLDLQAQLASGTDQSSIIIAISIAIMILYIICAFTGCFFVIVGLILGLISEHLGPDGGPPSEGPGPGPTPAANRRPDARDDSFTLNQRSMATGNVFSDNGNGPDTDPDGDALIASLIQNVSSGTVSLLANGAFSYTPNAAFFGTDSFMYLASDGKGGTDMATVTFQVLRVNGDDDDDDGDGDSDGVGDLCDSATLILPPNTSINNDVTLQPGMSLAVGSGSQIRGNIKGDNSNAVCLGSGAVVQGNIEEIGTLTVDGSNVHITGNFENSVNRLIVSAGASVTFAGNVKAAGVTIKDGGTANFQGNVRFELSLVMGGNATLGVSGNLECGPAATSSIDAGATILVGGNDICAATP